MEIAMSSQFPEVEASRAEAEEYGKQFRNFEI